MSKGLTLSSRKPVQLVCVAAILLLRPPQCGPLTILDHTLRNVPRDQQGRARTLGSCKSDALDCGCPFDG